MMGSIVEELVAYNPTAGAVFGVELMRMGHMMIAADDGSTPYVMLPPENLDWSGGIPRVRVAPPPPSPNGNRAHRKTDVPPMTPVPPNASAHSGDIPLLETVRGRPPSPDAPLVPPKRAPTAPMGEPPPRASEPNLARAGSQPSPEALAAASGEIRVRAPSQGDGAPRPAGVIEVPRSPDEITQPHKTPVPGSVRLQSPVPSAEAPVNTDEPRGAILGIGVGHIGSGSAVAGEIPTKVAPGARVLVPGPNGLMQSATVRQLLSGYYELEVGSSGETIWVPVNGVVPE